MNVKKNILVFLGAFLCCFLWGSAFPGIKVGYDLWNIEGNETWRIIRFAGVRFFLAGILVIIISSISTRKMLVPRKNEWGRIMLLSLFQTIGQYVFFYLGLAHTTGVNSAVVDSLTTFFAIIIASIFMHMEKLSSRKVLGCILGFAGVLIINITPEGFSFRPLGDGLIILSALCYGVSSSLIKKYSVEHDTVLFSGYQFTFGGLVMMLLGQIGIITIDPAQIGIGNPDNKAGAIAILIYLALISSVAYTLWGILLRKNDVSKIAIFGFMTPVIGVLLSAIFLGEADTLGVKYIFALILICAGIIIVNKQIKDKDSSESTDESI